MADTKNSVQRTTTSPNNNANNNVVTIDLVEVFYLLWRHILQIILCAVIGGAAMFFITSTLIAPKYTATSRMYILSSSSDSAIDLSDLQISSQLKSDYQELLTSRSILEDVKDQLNLSYDVSTLKNMISVTNPTDTRILNIAVTSTSAKEAADIANSIAQNGREYLPQIMKTQEPSVFESAEVPQHRSSPNVTRDAVIGALVLALIDIAILIIRYMMNDTLVTEEDVTKFLGYQPLAVIPEHNLKKGKKGARR